MSQNIKLKRSSVQGKVPTTSDLELGELAINTYDGKIFLKKDDGSESIVDVTSTGGGAEISTTAPSSPVEGNLWWDSTDGNLYIYYDDGDSEQWVSSISPETRIPNNLRVKSLGVGTDPSGTEGEIRATGDITSAYSDDRLKERDGIISDALEKINSLSTFYYYPSEIARDLGVTNQSRSVGLSAQEVEKIIPEVVKPAPIAEEYLTIQYEKLVPLLIAAIKEQQEQIEELKQCLQ